MSAPNPVNTAFRPSSSPLPITDQNTNFRMSTSVENTLSPAATQPSCISQLLSNLLNWMKWVFSRCFSSASPVIQAVLPASITAQQLEQRIQKGRQWILQSIDHNFANTSRSLHRDKFIVQMSYNGITAIAFPTSLPVNLEQLKREAIVKLEALMRSPIHLQQNEASLDIRTHFFTRLVRQTDGAISPFIWHGSERHSCDFPSQHDGYMTHGERLDPTTLGTWLEQSIPASLAERQTIVNYVADAIHWQPE